MDKASYDAFRKQQEKYILEGIKHWEDKHKQMIKEMGKSMQFRDLFVDQKMEPLYPERPIHPFTELTSREQWREWRENDEQEYCGQSANGRECHTEIALLH